MRSPSVLEILLDPSRLYWDRPKSRHYAAVADPGLYREVLEMARSAGHVSVEMLMSEEDGLRQRLRRLWLVEKLTRTTIAGAVSALQRFGWLQERPGSRGRFALSDEGARLVSEVIPDDRQFRRLLAVKLHGRYCIPGWFVSRLLAINPDGQGEVVLPSPLKDWKPEKRRWEDQRWTDELGSQIRLSAGRARHAFPGSFPVDDREWHGRVQDAWLKMGSRKQRKVSRVSERHAGAGEKPEVTHYSPRGRLSRAMREAAIDLLFENRQPLSGAVDFLSDKHPIPPRSFRAWCPRLDDLELVFYTDSHPSISGRLLFPCAVFSSAAPGRAFEHVGDIVDPQGRYLWLHQPDWSMIGTEFLDVLEDAAGRLSRSVGSVYVSLLDVRDEVCRRLRLSSLRFDELLETAYRETIQDSVVHGRSLSISLESDIRLEQRSGHGLLRRPVYLGKVPHSLIAIAAAHSALSRSSQ